MIRERALEIISLVENLVEELRPLVEKMPPFNVGEFENSDPPTWPALTLPENANLIALNKRVETLEKNFVELSEAVYKNSRITQDFEVIGGKPYLSRDDLSAHTSEATKSLETLDALKKSPSNFKRRKSDR